MKYPSEYLHEAANRLDVVEDWIADMLERPSIRPELQRAQRQRDHAVKAFAEALVQMRQNGINIALYWPSPLLKGRWFSEAVSEQMRELESRKQAG